MDRQDRQDRHERPERRQGGNRSNGYSGRQSRSHDRHERVAVQTAEQPLPPSDNRVMMTLAELEARSVDDLQDMAKELDISGYSRLKKQDLAFRILQAQTEQQGNIFKKGILDIMEDGFGFMRLSGYLPG